MNKLPNPKITPTQCTKSGNLFISMQTSRIKYNTNDFCIYFSVILCVLINMTRESCDNNANSEQQSHKLFWKLAFDWRARPTSGAFYVSLFSIQLVLCCLKTWFPSSLPRCMQTMQCRSPQITIKVTLSRVQHNSTIMHNARKKIIYIHSVFRASKTLLCVIFSSQLFLTKKWVEWRARKSISILKYTALHYLNEVNQKNSSIVTRGFKHATNTCRLRFSLKALWAA